MADRWDEFETELRSAEADRVNGVIDEIKDMDIGERMAIFDECFEGLTGLYADSDDGYVRQSCVRVAEQLTPGLAGAVTAQDEETNRTSSDRVYEQTDAVCGFFLEALTDEDGRVRNSATRGLKDAFRTYDSLGETETIEALGVELAEMASEHSGKQREHLLEAKEDAEFFLQSPFGRIAEGLQKEFGE